MSGDFEDRGVIVTGAAGGIGSVTAELFAAYGLAPLPPDDALFDTMTHLRATRT